MFIEEEFEALFCVLPAEFADGVFRDVGVQVCDVSGWKVNGKACPVIAVSMDGKEEVAVAERCALGKLVAPTCEPLFNKMEGVLRFGVALRSGLDHLCPYEQAKTVTVQLSVVGVAQLVTEVK